MLVERRQSRPKPYLMDGTAVKVVNLLFNNPENLGIAVINLQEVDTSG